MKINLVFALISFVCVIAIVFAPLFSLNVTMAQELACLAGVSATISVIISANN